MASWAVWRNLLPYICQEGLQPGGPSRRAAPGEKYLVFNGAQQQRYVQESYFAFKGASYSSCNVQIPCFQRGPKYL